MLRSLLQSTISFPVLKHPSKPKPNKLRPFSY